jgi:hypothetical protein
LPGDGPALGDIGFLKSILPHIHERDEIQRLGVMNIEPAGMMQGRSGFLESVFVQVNPAKCHRGPGMPPIRARKFP